MLKLKGGIEGFTLIELMVTLALVGLVIAGGFSLYFFADRSFVSGTVTADIQTDVQLAMQRITNELRLAHHIEFGKEVPESGLEADEHYLLVNNDGLVALRTQHPQDQILTSTNPEVANYQLFFEEVTGVPNTLKVKLTSLNEQVPYSLESEIQVMNIRLGGFEGIGPSNSIYFTKTLSAVERGEAEVIRQRCPIASIILDDQDPDLALLRSFRDDILQKTLVGKAIVHSYYSNATYLIDVLERIPQTQMFARGFLRLVTIFLKWQDAYIHFVAVVAVAITLKIILTNRRLRAMQKCNIFIQ